MGDLAGAVHGHYHGSSGRPGKGADKDALHRYWVAGPGLARWAHSPHPWTALHRHLAEYLAGPELDATTSKWHNEIMPATGNDSYRVAHGGKMRGKRIGPG